MHIWIVVSFSSFYGFPHPRDLHSFPTRRSSDLERAGKRYLDREGIEDLDVLDRSDLASPRRGQIAPVKDVKVLDPFTVEITLSSPFEIGRASCRERV